MQTYFIKFFYVVAVTALVFFVGVLHTNIVFADTDSIDPNGDGTTLQGTKTTCGGTGNYDCVNDGVRSPTAPSTAGDFITLTSNKEDIYAMTTVGNVSGVTSIEVFVYHKESLSTMQFAVHLWNAAESAFLAPAQNILNRSSTAWDSATFSGLTLSQSDLDAMRIGILCEKTGAGSPGSCNAYAVYAVVTHTANSLFTQEDFRFYVNQDNLLTPTNDPWPEGSNDLDENKEIPPGFSMGQFKIARIRINVAISNTNLAASTQDFKLQYAVLTAPSCVEQGSGWTDVAPKFSTSGDFRFYGNAFADTATISTTLLSTSNIGGSYSEVNPSPLNPNAAVVGAFVEYDWPIQLVVAASGSDYCFRMIKSNGSLLDVYRSDSFPKVRTKSIGGASEEGGPPPPATHIGGGDVSGGGEVGTDPGALIGFSSPTAAGEDYFAWLNPLSALVSDNSNASALQGGLQQDYYNFGFGGGPEGSVITGIEFKIEASTSGAGEIQIALSHDGGAIYTTALHSTGALTGSDAIYTVGSGGDLWDRASWSAGDISNANFRMRITSVGVADAIRIDHIQAKVHHVTTGGTPGGGGEVFRWNLFRFFARVFDSIITLFSFNV